MRVLFVDQIAKVNYKYSFNLANALKKNGADVEFVIDKKQEAEGCICNRINLFNTDEKNIGKLKKAVNYVISMGRICRMMKEYDVIHTQWIIFSPVDWFYLRKIKRMKKKLVMTIHDILPFEQKFYDYFFHKKIYEMADEIIVQAPDNVTRFHELFPDCKVPVHMIAHGNFLQYANIQPRGEARKRLGISKDKFVYLFFGQIKKIKGVDYLLKAYAKLLKQYPELKKEVELVIAGSVWKMDFSVCERIIQEENLTEGVRLDIRYIPDDEVGVYYSAADVCVLPYLEVYQSGVLQLTYAYHKTPIVTRIPVFQDIVTEDRGVLCEPKDVDDLARALRDVYYERERLHEKAECGYSYIEREFDWDKIAGEIVRLY